MSADPFVSFASRVFDHAKLFPHQRAVVCDARTLTYEELTALSCHYALKLQALGLQAGGEQRVAIIAANSVEYVAAVLGCHISGIPVVPLPVLIMPDALARMLDDSNSAVIFHDAESTEQSAAAAGLSARTRSLTRIELGRLDLLLTDALVNFTPVQLDVSWTSDFIYSSGTTGIPKGIVQSYGARSSYCTSLASVGVTPQFELLLTTGLYSNFGMAALLLTLWWGGTFFIQRKFSAAATVSLLEHERMDMAWFAPATLVRTMEALAPDSSARGKSFVKLCAGAPLSSAQKKAVLATWRGAFWDLYGQTETGTLTLLALHCAPEEKFGSVGRALPSVALRIIDDAGKVLAEGQEGEIAAHSTTLMTGYHGQQSASATLWRDDVERLYIRTGDIGTIDAEGYLWLCDRKKDMIKSGGSNVYPADIERTLQDHPAVLEAAVVGFESVRWGESPVAFLTLRNGINATEDELKAWVNARVGSIQRVAAVKILTELPAGSMGKILKRQLRNNYADVVGPLP